MNLRLIYLSSFVFFFLACKAKQEPTEKDVFYETIINYCPKGGTCSFEVLKSKSLEIKTDGTGAQYPQITEGEKTVLKFEYKKEEDPKIADDGYTEVIYTEIKPTIHNLDLKDEELSQAKVLFGRLCFCRGQTGYYPVESGHLEIKSNKNDSVSYTLSFKITEVPHILKEISVIQR